MPVSYVMILVPQFQALARDGTPLAGGKVFTYEAGSSTLKTTYAELGMSTANTNPVVLDAEGRADIWWTGPMKVVVQDATGVQLYTQDNLFGFGGSLALQFPVQDEDKYLVWGGVSGAVKNSGLTMTELEQIVEAWRTAMITNSGVICVSPTDTTPGTLSQKIVGAPGTTTTILNAGGNEQMQVSAVSPYDPQLAVYQNAF